MPTQELPTMHIVHLTDDEHTSLRRMQQGATTEQAEALRRDIKLMQDNHRRNTSIEPVCLITRIDAS